MKIATIGHKNLHYTEREITAAILMCVSIKIRLMLKCAQIHPYWVWIPQMYSFDGCLNELKFLLKTAFVHLNFWIISFAKNKNLINFICFFNFVNDVFKITLFWGSRHLKRAHILCIQNFIRIETFWIFAQTLNAKGSP